MNQLIKRLFFITFTAATVFLCSCGNFIPRYIATSATIEAGAAFSAADFILEDGHTGEFSADFSAQFVKDGVAKINRIGEYSVDLTVDGKTYTIALKVQDTIAPKASACTTIICLGDSLTAEQCITDIQDHTATSCVFKNEPDLTQTGVVNEIVVLTDEAGNHTEIPVTITVLGIGDLLADTYTIEAGEKIPAAEEMIALNRTGIYITDISVINTSLVGSYTLEVEIEGSVYSTELIIEDTIAPTATVTPITVYYGADFPSADSFVSTITDIGPVTVSYDIDPGEKVSDQSTIRIVLTDQGGNKTYYDTQCTIVHDNDAPTFITFPEELEADLNAAIIWRALVSAEDNSGTVDITLDTTDANLEKAGTYTVYFVAKDPAGNETRQETKLVLHDDSVTKEMMDQVCEEILSKIITEGMTPEQQLYAIYRYIINHVWYTSKGAHDDLRREAYLGLTTRKCGDCFTFCAASHELLSYLGYDTQIVRRRLDLVQESGNHFWLLVNCGTEEEPLWYHHDSCPIARPYNRKTYMMTDAQLIAYTNYRAATSSKKNYYTFDTSLHPASATEIVVDLGIDSQYFE